MSAPTPARSEMVKAVVQVLKDMADGKLNGISEKAEWHELAPPFIAAVLDNLPRGAMTLALSPYIDGIGDAERAADAAISAARRSVLGHE